MNDIATAAAGHNNPPRDSIIGAQDAFNGLSRYLKEHPVVESLDDAKTAKTYVDAAKDVLKKLEDDRNTLVRPLNERVKATNSEFRIARDPLQKLLDELLARLETYRAAEEEKRLAALEEARKRAVEAERIAREAEAREREAIENAAEGEFTDVGAATTEADKAFDDFKRANRAAAIAARDANVRINDGIGSRALSARTHETLEITNPIFAIRDIAAERGDGTLPDKLREAILSAARDYRKAKGKLPDGVVSHKTRSL